MKKFIVLLFCLILFTLGSGFKQEEDYIKWVDLNVPYEVMLAALEFDKEFHESNDVQFSFEKALAYLATKNGNKFSTSKDIKELKNLIAKLKEGNQIDDFYGENKYYKYYKAAYNAIFAGIKGEYKEEGSDEIKYGLTAHHPFAKGYWYNHYDDFGNARSYGFKRKHLGHDLMGSIGTPIIAIEDGIVTEIGWNKYGGWRLSIRTNDSLRSYYYAHLRKNKPYIENLKKGDSVTSGQVIGYLGVTGYSTKENKNMSTKPHLHLGMQLIFNEVQYKGPKEIWVDMYQLCKLFSHNRAVVEKGEIDFKTISKRTKI